ncbi:MAG: zinc ribbon domain-containing protein [Candidatus Moranbacteria bacterium]|nr:zinc ribbon domain-containing protein [Candidatus Moranbacteria bacterium]
MDEKSEFEPEISTENTVDPHCMSCGMPMRTDEEYGTNTDGSRCDDYCMHCMVKGERK